MKFRPLIVASALVVFAAIVSITAPRLPAQSAPAFSLSQGSAAATTYPCSDFANVGSIYTQITNGGTSSVCQQTGIASLGQGAFAWVGVPGTSTANTFTATQTFSTVAATNVQAGTVNYIATEGGAANAITSAAGSGPALGTGLVVLIQLAHTLQAGANTFAYNGGTAVAIKSHRNVGNNIGTAYAATGSVQLYYDGTEWQDLSQ